jgi:NAD(P)-dependent dehydrogenase (short-subunit alcohol dehydrogenase family)
MAQKVCITGVSSGLGHGLAKVYLEQGVEVYGCSRREPADLIETGLRFASDDLSDTSGSAQKVFNQLIQNVRRFDIVILNADIRNL